LLPFLLTLIKRKEAAEGGSFWLSPLIFYPGSMAGSAAESKNQERFARCADEFISLISVK
jgi:hypothetical protein